MTPKELSENIQTVYITLGMVAGLLWAAALTIAGAPLWLTIVTAVVVALLIAIFSVSAEKDNDVDN